MEPTHETWIAQAIELAAAARCRGDHPFGALLVVGTTVVATARNAVNTDHDVTQHAELRLISKACRSLAPTVLASATLYTSTEPCAMCAGAIYWAGVRHIVYGLGADELTALAGGVGLSIGSRDVLAAASDPVSVVGPVMADAARRVHDGFW